MPLTHHCLTLATMLLDCGQAACSPMENKSFWYIKVASSIPTSLVRIKIKIPLASKARVGGFFRALLRLIPLNEIPGHTCSPRGSFFKHPPIPPNNTNEIVAELGLKCDLSYVFFFWRGKFFYVFIIIARHRN